MNFRAGTVVLVLGGSLALYTSGRKCWLLATAFLLLDSEEFKTLLPPSLDFAYPHMGPRCGLSALLHRAHQDLEHVRDMMITT